MIRATCCTPRASGHRVEESLKTCIIVFTALAFMILANSAAGQQVPRLEIGPTVSLMTMRDCGRCESLYKYSLRQTFTWPCNRDLGN